MATIDKVRELILKLKKKNITKEDLKAEALLVQDLHLDSLDFSELLVLAETAFSMEIEPDHLKEITTIASVAEYIDKRLKK